MAVRQSFARAIFGRLLSITCLGSLVILGTSLSAAESAKRQSQDLLALYTFSRSSQDLIQDQSGSNEPIHLRIEKPSGVLFRNGSLDITSSARISSAEPARRITSALKESNAFSVEVWAKPQDVRQSGPARIVTLSADPGQRNFTLGQDKGRYDVRIRTTSTDNNGMPSTATPDGSLKSEQTHIVVTYKSKDSLRIYLNGKQVASKSISGDLNNWNDGFRLSLGNELTGDRPWLGELYLVAIYGRALTKSEIAGNFTSGVPPAVDYSALLPPPIDRPVDFLTDVQPLLRKHCYECHAEGSEEGGVNLGVRQRAFEGGHNGKILVPGKSAESRLIHLVAAVEKDEVMPPDEPRLTKEEIGILRAWIDQGTRWPDGADVLDPRIEKAKTHWAFQPLKTVSQPAVQDSTWIKTPIDRFVLASLEKAGLRPQAPAASRELLRRITFDVIGLPPTPEEVRDFDQAMGEAPQSALAALVDRLLNSPQYGERWGRHWLDVARYADSDGQESDRDRPTAYRYRDFVIRALNDDLPFDQFVRWQLAGDEYEPQNVEAVAATGFLTAGPFAALPDRLMEDERLRNRYNELDDMLSTIGTGFLGLTLGCCRCHDHKFDAIPSRDYYRLMAALHSGDRKDVTVGPSKESVLAYRDDGSEPRATWLFHRGDYYDRRQPVQLGFVSLLTNEKSPEDYLQAAREQSAAKNSTNQRRALADWITDVPHGAGALLARVIVNRVWQHHFGHGLVRTISDFGVRSEPPTHPELLEWLSQDFMQNGWRLKRLHRMILLSSVYQQSSASPTRPEADPDNRLLWKMPLRRLEAEVLRDSMLSVSGTLNVAMYGPSVKPPIVAEAMLARNLKDPYPSKIEDGPSVRRRSIYLFHKRVVPYPLLQAFDKPDAQQSCGRRDNTTVAPQSLALLNDPFVRRVSLDFAERLLREAGIEPDACIERGYKLALARSPAELERNAAVAFVKGQIQERTNRAPQAPIEQVRRDALADFCQMLFSLNEFVYVD